MWYETQREVRRNEMGLVLDFGSAVLKHPEAQGLHAMWNALRGDRIAPFRAELDAHRIGAKAPFLGILEYVGPSNFRIRIAGDRLNKWFGIELRGMSALSLLDTAARNHFQATLNRVTAEPSVAALHGVARGPDGFVAHFEMVLLPMRSDFGRVDRVLVGIWLMDAPGMLHGPLRLEPDSFTVGAISCHAGLLDQATEADPAPLPLRAAAAPVPVVLRSIDGGAASETAPDMSAARGDDAETPDPSPPRRGSHLRLVKKG